MNRSSQRRSVQASLTPFADKFAGWLKTEAGKSRKLRRTVKPLHADLVVLGFSGSYGRVAAFARRWCADHQREQQTTGRGTFAPLHFDPGDAFQFDWSEDFAVLGGERTKLRMAHIMLSHSRAFLLRAYPYLLGGLRIDRSKQVWCADITYLPPLGRFVLQIACRAMDAQRLSLPYRHPLAGRRLVSIAVRHGLIHPQSIRWAYEAPLAPRYHLTLAHLQHSGGPVRS